MIRCFFNHHVWRCFLIRWWWQTCLSGKSSSGHLRWKEIAGTKLNMFVFSPVSFSVCRYWPEMLSQLTYLSRLQYTCKYVPTCFITEVDAFVLTKHVDFAETKSKAFRHVWWLASLARLLVACCVAMIQNCASLWCSYASLFSWGHNPRLERTRSDGSLSSAVPSAFFVRPGPQALVGGRERWAAATSRCSHMIRVYNQKMDISQQEYKREHQGNPIIWDRATDSVPLRHIAALSFPGPQALVGGRERWAAATSRCSHMIRVYNQKMDISQQEYKREHQGNPIIWDRATDSVPLRHIAALSFPQPTNLRRLPGPPVYIFSGDGKPPWLGGPKAHTPHDIFIHVGFESLRFLFFFWFTWKWDFATLPFDTRRHDTRYTCPGSSSGLMILKGSDGVPWPCHQPRYIYRHFFPIESMITFGLQCQ